MDSLAVAYLVLFVRDQTLGLPAVLGVIAAIVLTWTDHSHLGSQWMLLQHCEAVSLPMVVQVPGASLLLAGTLRDQWVESKEVP